MLGDVKMRMSLSHTCSGKPKWQQRKCLVRSVTNKILHALDASLDAVISLAGSDCGDDK